MRAADRQDARSALSSVSRAIGAFCLAVALCAFFGTHACNAQRYINVDGSDSVLVRNIQVVVSGSRTREEMGSEIAGGNRSHGQVAKRMTPHQHLSVRS